MTEDQGNYEHEMRVWEAKLAWAAQISNILTSALIDFASLAIKSIILANSASAGAVLALLAAVWNSPTAAAVVGPAVESVTIFAAGTFAAMVCAALSYLAQYCYATGDEHADETRWKKPMGAIAPYLHFLAVVVAVAGIASFALGAYEGISALEAARDALGSQTHPPLPLE